KQRNDSFRRGTCRANGLKWCFMPSRLITGAIVLFWLGMTTWLIYREVVPMMRAGLSPSYLIDLTDEIGSPMVSWKITMNGKRIGSGTTQIHVNEDRT